MQPALNSKPRHGLYLYSLLALLFFALPLSGCSTNPSTPISGHTKQTMWLKHKNSLELLQNWQINGRFSAKTDTENWTGSITWLQNQQEYRININGPLGTGSIMLEGDDNFAQMQLTESRFDSDTSAQSLLYRHTGLTLPINALKYWLLGIPSPSDSAIKLNKQGRLSKLRQNNWEVTFKRYTTQDNMALPNKIFLAKNGIKVRLIIQTWQIYN